MSRRRRSRNGSCACTAWPATRALTAWALTDAVGFIVALQCVRCLVWPVSPSVSDSEVYWHSLLPYRSLCHAQSCLYGIRVRVQVAHVPRTSPHHIHIRTTAPHSATNPPHTPHDTHTPPVTMARNTLTNATRQLVGLIPCTRMAIY